MHYHHEKNESRLLYRELNQLAVSTCEIPVLCRRESKSGEERFFNLRNLESYLPLLESR